MLLDTHWKLLLALKALTQLIISSKLSNMSKMCCDDVELNVLIVWENWKKQVDVKAFDVVLMKVSIKLVVELRKKFGLCSFWKFDWIIFHTVHENDIKVSKNKIHFNFIFKFFSEAVEQNISGNDEQNGAVHKKCLNFQWGETLKIIRTSF